MELPFVVLVFVLVPCILAEDDSEDPMQLYMQNEHRPEPPKDNTLQSIHKNLKQHTETLEKVLAVVQRNEELTKRIIENLNEKLDEPEKHGKIKVYHSNRRSNNENEEIPIVKFGKDIVRYGNLLKTVIMSDITKSPELIVDENDKIDKKEVVVPMQKEKSGSPITVQEAKQNSERNQDVPITDYVTEHNIHAYSGRRNAMYEESTQRSKNKNINLGIYRNEQKNNANSPWCDVAAKCIESFVPVCGFDDNFGRSKFDSTCHMLKVNCYWNYNFTIVLCQRSVN